MTSLHKQMMVEQEPECHHKESHMINLAFLIVGVVVGLTGMGGGAFTSHEQHSKLLEKHQALVDSLEF